MLDPLCTETKTDRSATIWVAVANSFHKYRASHIRRCVPRDRSQVLNTLESKRAGNRLQTARVAGDNCVGLGMMRGKIVTAS